MEGPEAPLRQAFKWWWWQLPRETSRRAIWAHERIESELGKFPSPWDMAGVTQWAWVSFPSHKRPDHRIRLWRSVYGGTRDYRLAVAATELALNVCFWERCSLRGDDVRWWLPWVLLPWGLTARRVRVSTAGVSSRRARERWVDRSWRARRGRYALCAVWFCAWRRVRWWRRAIIDWHHLHSTVYWVPTLRGIGDPFGQERRLRFGTSIPRRWGVQVAESLRHWWLWHWQRKNGRGEAEGSGTDSYCAEHCSPSHPPPGEGREIAHGKEEDCRGLAEEEVGRAA